MPDAETKPKSRSKVKTIAEILQSWEDIRAAGLDKADRLGPAAPQFQALEDLIQRAREMRGRHEAHKADTKQLTQDFRALREEGKETVRRFQSIVRGLLGTRQEELSQFKVKATGRPRKSRSKEQPPPAGGTPAPTPGPSAVKAAEPEEGGDGP